MPEEEEEGGGRGVWCPHGDCLGDTTIYYDEEALVQHIYVTHMSLAQHMCEVHKETRVIVGSWQMYWIIFSIIRGL